MKKFIFIGLFLLWTIRAQAATQLLKTVMPSGGDYTSLEACMNANEQNLVTADKYFDVKIDGTWSAADTTACVIELYTTDATRYINVYTTAAARHLGVWSTNRYILQVITTGIITSSVDFIRITGLQIDVNSSADYKGGIILTEGGWVSSNIQISKNIIKKTGTGSHGYGISDGTFHNAGTPTIYFWNNMVYGFTNFENAGIRGYVSAGTVYFYNNTVYNCNKQFLQERGTVIPVNNIANGAGTGYSGIFTSAVDNISEDTTSPNNEWDNTAVAFVSETAGSEDFHLVTGSAAIDGGTDLSTTFTDDIDGVTRSGTWDIGADEFVSGVVTIPSLIINDTVFIQNMIVQ